MRILLMAILTSILLSGCNGVKLLDIISSPAPTIIQQPPAPRAVIMRPIKWKVLNAEILKELLKNNENVQFIALTSAGYENLSLNMAELRRYMQQQKQIIIYYQSLTNGANIDTPKGKKWKFKDLNFLNDKKIKPESKT